jgi:ABC-type antimicrobial peptide transport system permease subunit
MVMGLSVGGIGPYGSHTRANAAIAIGLILGVFAAVVPARQASSMDILHALRYE